jgi:hypothetical protein
MRLRKSNFKKNLRQKVPKSHGLTEKHSGLHNYCMALFRNWMTSRDTATLLRLRLLESAAFFSPGDYNPLFDAELEKVILRIHDPELRQQVSELKIDWANYIVRSLQRSGFKDDDIQEHFHAIVVRLLVSPGGLFARWQPGKHGPLERRFRTSVWNSIRNLVEKTKNRRKWMTSHDPSIMADRYAGRAPYSDLIDQFRSLVAERLGKLASEILDAKLSGEDAKNLVGKAANGTASAYYIKQEIRGIKELAYEFAQQTGDQVFLNKLAKAMESGRATVAKRQQAVAARQAQ